MFSEDASRVSLNDAFIGLFMLTISVVGLLKGYELIMDARVRNLADQVVKIQSSYYKFIDFYRETPGDWSFKEASSVIPGIEIGGNGNGRLDLIDGDPWVESLAVWEHLCKAKFLDADYLRESKVSGKGVVKVPINAFGAPMILFSSRDYYDVSEKPVKRVGLILGRGTPVSVLAKLDKKIDDGYPATGVIRYVANMSNTFGDLSKSGSKCIDDTKTPAVWLVGEPEMKCNAIHLY